MLEIKQNWQRNTLIIAVVRKEVNARAASHSSALIFCFICVQCCQIAKTNVMTES